VVLFRNFIIVFLKGEGREARKKRTWSRKGVPEKRKEVGIREIGKRVEINGHEGIKIALAFI